MLPYVIKKSLKYRDMNEDSSFGRDYEVKQIEYMRKHNPNDIWILSGPSNVGKTEFIKKLQKNQDGIIYIDLRYFFDGNSFGMWFCNIFLEIYGLCIY